MHEVNQYFYAVFDKIAGTVSHMCCCSSSGEACRKIIATLPALNFYDYQIYCIGEYCLKAPPVGITSELYLGKDVEVRFYPQHKWKLVPWSDWRRPESEAELLAPLGVSADEAKAIVEARFASLNGGRHD